MELSKLERETAERQKDQPCGSARQSPNKVMIHTHPSLLTSSATLLEVPHPNMTRAGSALYTNGCILSDVMSMVKKKNQSAGSPRPPFLTSGVNLNNLHLSPRPLRTGANYTPPRPANLRFSPTRACSTRAPFLCVRPPHSPGLSALCGWGGGGAGCCCCCCYPNLTESVRAGSKGKPPPTHALTDSRPT